jgi:uncharacterized membrane protein
MHTTAAKQEGFGFQMMKLRIIGTSQVSDVCVTSKSLRRTVTAHGLLSFIFNVTLLALAINLAASAIGNLGGS